jgi:hypothetical protein
MPTEAVCVFASVFDLIMRNVPSHPPSSGNVALLLFIAFCAISQASFSQNINNVDFRVSDNIIQVTYDIDDCAEDERYDIKLFLGKGGNLREISRGLSGDIKNVPCGHSKMIVWDVLADRIELKGRIHFVVEIGGVQKLQSAQSSSRRSWRDDKGYFGGSIGVFSPYDIYASGPAAPEQHGFFLNTTVGYLPTLLLGLCSSIFIYGSATSDDIDVSTWTSCGITIGPMISIPLGNKIKWEFRPQIGYSFSSINSKVSVFADSTGNVQSGVAYSVGAGFRLNLGKRTCYLLNVEYFSTKQQFEHYRAEPITATLGCSIGVAFRFY